MRPKYRSSGRTRPGIRGKNGAKPGRYIHVTFNPDASLLRFTESKSFADLDEAVAYAKTQLKQNKFYKTAEVRARIAGEEHLVRLDRKS